MESQEDGDFKKEKTTCKPTVHPKKVSSSNQLRKLIQRKKVVKESVSDNVQVLLNDYDLDVNEIFSWFRGATDELSISNNVKKLEKEEQVNSCVYDYSVVIH